MLFSDEIHKCKNFNELRSLIELNTETSKVHVEIGRTGGRYFTCEGYSGKVPLKEILTKLDSLNHARSRSISSITNLEAVQVAKEENKKVDILLSKIKQLDGEANKLLKQQCLIIRCLTVVRQVFGNVIVGKKVQIEELEKDVKKDWIELREKHLEFEKSAVIQSRKGFKPDSFTQELRNFDRGSISDSVVGVYITSNENGLENVREVLKTHPEKTNGIHIGFSGWHNFDIIIQRHSKYALIADFNQSNALFLNQTLLALRSSESRKHFIEKITKSIQESEITFSANVGYDELVSSEEEIANELTREGSWLSTDEGFHYIKKMAESDKIALITNDIRNFADFKNIAKVLSENKLHVDSLYVSNIYAYMREETDKNAYHATLESLMEDDTLVIKCIPGQFDDLKQQALPGKILRTTK